MGHSCASPHTSQPSVCPFSIFSSACLPSIHPPILPGFHSPSRHVLSPSGCTTVLAPRQGVNGDDTEALPPGATTLWQNTATSNVHGRKQHGNMSKTSAEAVYLFPSSLWLCILSLAVHPLGPPPSLSHLYLNLCNVSLTG